MTHARRSPFVTGGVLALGSAAAFGATIPLLQHFGRGVGPFGTAALLYAGAALASAVPPRRAEGPLGAQAFGRIIVVALLGAFIAPVALAWALQHTNGITASLLLNLEAVFTVLLARVVWHETIGRRVTLAVLAIVAGGVLLVLDGRNVSVAGSWGAMAVVVATLAWAGDNVVGRSLAERDPARVVAAKGLLGAAMSFGLAVASGEAAPRWRAALAIAACGAVGYGASLRLYLRAQRVLGAARTGSIFAVAPFLGAALAWGLGERAGGIATTVAGALCALGAVLHLTERHEHAHRHPAMQHEHAHRHDDGHHTHGHDVYPEGEHSHPHHHEALTHEHSHAEDVHHRHHH